MEELPVKYRARGGRRRSSRGDESLGFGSVRCCGDDTPRKATNERGNATEEGNSRTGYGSVDAHVPLHVTRLRYAKVGRATGYVFARMRACFSQKLPESRLLTNKRIDPSSKMESLNGERPI